MDRSSEVSIEVGQADSFWISIISLLYIIFGKNKEKGKKEKEKTPWWFLTETKKMQKLGREKPDLKFIVVMLFILWHAFTICLLIIPD
jgi:hypothetical protein